MSGSPSYDSDTLPAHRLPSSLNFNLNPSSPSPGHPQPHPNTHLNLQMSSDIKSDTSDPSTQPKATRKLCVRHQRMADEGTNLKLQQSLNALPLQEREAVNAVWSNFSSSSHPRRALILQGLLTMCCFSQLSLLTEQLAHLIRIDPFAIFPREVSLKILGSLDATSLCRAAQVSRQWKSLADDDILWRGICEQHIGQKCPKCGWGLPIMEKKHVQSSSPSPSPGISSSGTKRISEARTCTPDRPPKRQRSELAATSTDKGYFPHFTHSLDPSLTPDSSTSLKTFPTRPWKDVYSERLTIERNWRRGRCSVRTLKGHTDGVMCLQFVETLTPGPSCPILITGSYDCTARVWNLETGAQLRCLQGHTLAIRALQFDAAKLITGSMDHTIRVWNWREGRCVRTLTGHEGGVVCLNFDSNVLASGSVDTKIKVWNLRTQEAFTLRGHTDWVNAVQLWDSSNNVRSSPDPSPSVFESMAASSANEPHIDPGKMLFSASDDGTIRLWDLTLRTCVRWFTGHVAQVQSMKLQLVDDDCDSVDGDGDAAQIIAEERPLYRQQTASSSRDAQQHVLRSDSVTANSETPSPSGFYPSSFDERHPGGPGDSSQYPPPNKRKRANPVLISGSLDNTIKLWDIDTGKTLNTFFGHIEGVWAVASDKLRLVSGSHDRTIKVWVREEGQCTATLVGHRGAVTSLALGDDKIVSGSDDGDIKIWTFSG